MVSHATSCRSLATVTGDVSGPQRKNGGWQCQGGREGRLVGKLERKGVIRPAQRWQLVQAAGVAAAVIALAGIGFMGEFAAGAGTLWVDFATDLDADGSLEGNAPPWLIAGAAHVGAAAQDGSLLG